MTEDTENGEMQRYEVKIIDTSPSKQEGSELLEAEEWVEVEAVDSIEAHTKANRKTPDGLFGVSDRESPRLLEPDDDRT